MTFTRPDIIYATCLVSRYMEEPKQEHYTTANLKEYKGSISYGLLYTSEDSRLIGYTDSELSWRSRWAKVLRVICS